MGILRPQEEGLTSKKYTYEIKRARGESMTSWIKRSVEALMDMRKKLASALGANSSESMMILPLIQGWLFTHRARLQYQHIVGVMTTTRCSLNIKLVVICSPMMPFSQLITLMVKTGDSRTQHACEAIEEVPEDDDETHLNDDYIDDDDPYVDEDVHFLANVDVVCDVDDEVAFDDEEYREALLGYREARDLMKEARLAREFSHVAVPIRSDKPTGRGEVNPQVARMC